MQRKTSRGIHHKKCGVEASTSSQKLVKALDYYVVIVTGWKHHYYTGWLVYFVVWHVAARSPLPRRAHSRLECSAAPTRELSHMHFSACLLLLLVPMSYPPCSLSTFCTKCSFDFYLLDKRARHLRLSHFIIFKIVEHILKLTQELCKKVLPNSWSNNLKFLCEKFNKTQQCFTTQLLLTLNPIMLVNTRVDISISVK